MKIMDMIGMENMDIKIYIMIKIKKEMMNKKKIWIMNIIYMEIFNTKIMYIMKI